MKSILKILAIVIGAAVVLFLVAAVVLPLIIDPNDYKDEMVVAVKEKTGRDLNIVGDIELSVFPWIGVELGTVELSNAEGFIEPVFARTERVNMRVKLAPLFSKRLEMDTVTIHGLTLNLARDEQGRSNWDDLAGPSASEAMVSTPTKTSDAGARHAGALAIGGLDIRDANLSWDDASQGQRYEISNLSVQTGSISPGEPVDLQVALDVAVGEPKIDGHVSVKGTLDVDPRVQLARLTNLVLEGDFSGEPLPKGKASIAMAADVSHDGVNKTLAVDRLLLEAMDLELQGNMKVSQFDTAPKLEGVLSIGEFNPREFLEAVGAQSIDTADPKALTRASLEATIAGGANQIIAKPLTVKLDDSTLQGELGVTDLKSQALRFQLALDAIDADRYLPPPAEGESAAAAKSGAATPGAAATAGAQAPNEALRALDVNGSVSIGKLKVARLNLSDLRVTLKAKDGLIKMHPVSATLYEGAYKGDITLDARGNQPKLTVNETLAGIQAGPLLKDLQGHDRLTGEGNVSIKLGMIGTQPDAIKKSLNGHAAFAFTDGAFKGVNVGRMIREANARLKGEKLPAQEKEQQTDFSELSGTVNINNGLAVNDDLSVKTPLLRIAGRGRVNLPQENVDYLVTTTVVATAKGQGGEELKDLAGIPIPIYVSGSFAEPKYALDFAALSEAVAKTKAKEAISKEIDERIGDDAVKGLLKGLLN